MRVLHVVTLVSPDAAFGGPVRVAENQAVELRARGHEITVAAGTRGYRAGGGQPEGAAGPPPRDLGGVPLRLFPVHPVLPGAGFSGLASAPMLLWLDREVQRCDVVHVHLARDLVTLPAAWLARRRRTPYVVQPHGMVVESGHRLAGVLDAGLTRRVLTGAAAVLHLTPQERDGLVAVARGPLPLHQLGNGVPGVPLVPALPAQPEVLFCARLHARKRPLMFVEMARALLAEGVDASFALVGPDEGQGSAVGAAVGGADPLRLRLEGPLAPSATLGRMAAASLLVLPSLDEPYPMTVLEAMSIGRPVVVTKSCGLAAAVAEYGCGLVVGETLPALVDGVRNLLADPAGLAAMAARAAAAAREHFGMAVVADRLEQAYDGASAGTKFDW